MSETKGIERYVPEHPLPDEVRKMERDETVCKYCGVSYLIHNEIKALEDKLRETQEELLHYQGSEAREQALKNELHSRDKTIEDLNKAIQGKDALLGTLKNEVKAKDEELVRVENAKKQVEETLSQCSQKLEQYKVKHQFVMANLPGVLSEVKHLRAGIHGLRAEEGSHRDTVKNFRQQLQTTVHDTCSKHYKEFLDLKDKMVELDNERISFKFKEDKYLKDIGTYEAQLQKMQSQNSNELVQLQQKYDQLWTENTEMQAQINQLRERLRVTEFETVQFKEQISAQAQSVENLQGQLNQRDMAAEQQVLRQQKAVAEKDNELQTVVRELGRMKKKFQEQQEDVEKKSSLSNMKTTELKEQLVRMRGDCDALKNEREMMITAHQNQIEQLRESFKQKLNMADSWPEKLQEALRKERDKHASELAHLEAKFKENFVMELQIEKQKHQELLDKYKNSNKDEEKDLQQRVTSLKSQHKSEVTELHKQLAENKARFRETENSMRAEIQSLKKIIHDLEQRLSRFDNGSDTKTAELKYEIKKLESELNAANEQARKLENQVTAAKEEVGFLQETVRRECEERFELTEALGTVKEELLALKKPPGGYAQNSSRIPSSVPSTRSPESARTVTSEEMTVFKKVNRLPQPPVKDKDFGSASAVTLGYEGGGESARKARAVRTSSMSSSRDRIAQAVGRR